MGISEFQFQQMLARTEKVRASTVKAFDEAELESETHDKIHQHATIKGWGIIHSRMDRKTTQAKGVSDFILLAPGPTVFFIEVKRPGKKLRPEQLTFAALCHRTEQLYAAVYSFEEYLDFVSQPDHLCNRKDFPCPASDAGPPSA